MSLLDSDAEELKKRSQNKGDQKSSGRKVNASGLGAFKNLSKYTNAAEKFRTTGKSEASSSPAVEQSRGTIAESAEAQSAEKPTTDKLTHQKAEIQNTENPTTAKASSRYSEKQYTENPTTTLDQSEIQKSEKPTTEKQHTQTSKNQYSENPTTAKEVQTAQVQSSEKPTTVTLDSKMSAPTKPLQNADLAGEGDLTPQGGVNVDLNLVSERNSAVINENPKVDLLPSKEIKKIEEQYSEKPTTGNPIGSQAQYSEIPTTEMLMKELEQLEKSENQNTEKQTTGPDLGQKSEKPTTVFAEASQSSEIQYTGKPTTENDSQAKDQSEKQYSEKPTTAVEQTAQAWNNSPKIAPPPVVARSSEIPTTTKVQSVGEQKKVINEQKGSEVEGGELSLKGEFSYNGWLPLQCDIFKPPVFTDLAPTAFKIYMYMTFLAWRYPVAPNCIRAAIPYLTTGTGVKKDAILSNIDLLEEAGLVKTVKVDKRNGNVYWVNPGYIAPLKKNSENPTAELKNNNKSGQKSEFQSTENQNSANPPSEDGESSDSTLKNRSQSSEKPNKDYTLLESSKLTYTQASKSESKIITSYLESIEAPGQHASESDFFKKLLATGKLSVEIIEIAYRDLKSNGIRPGEPCHLPMKFLYSNGQAFLDRARKTLEKQRAQASYQAPEEPIPPGDERRPAYYKWEMNLNRDETKAILSKIWSTDDDQRIEEWMENYPAHVTAALMTHYLTLQT